MNGLVKAILISLALVVLSVFGGVDAGALSNNSICASSFDLE